MTVPPSRTLAVLGALAVLAAPSVAAAQEPPPPVVVPVAPVAAPPPAPDMVMLRNGGMVRGRIQEILPGDHLTITIETGETRRIGWEAVERVMVAPTTRVAPPVREAEPAPSTDTPPPPMRGPLVRVHIATPKHVILNRRLDEGAPWTHACDSPCDVDLPLGDEYEIAGLGNGPSSGFALKGTPGQTVVITISPPSVAGIVLGGVLVIGGGVGAYFSLALGLVQAAVCSGEPNCSTAGFAVAGAVSGAAILGGALIIYLSARTGFDQDQAAAAPPATALLPEPIWREVAHPTTEIPPPSGAAFTVPLFTRTF